MTTIAWKDGFIAADSLVTANGTIVGNVPGVDGKLLRLNDGGVAGCTGSVGQDLVFARWMDAGADYDKRPQWPPDTQFAALVGYANRCFVYSLLMLPQATDRAFTALGSGWEFALAAMALGRSAREAVELAAQFDIYTGGKITEIQCPVPCAAQTLGAKTLSANAAPPAPTSG